MARKLLHLWIAALALAWLAEAPITWLNDWADWVGRHVPVVHHLYNRPGDIAAVVARFYGLVCGIEPVGVTYLLVGDDPLRHLQIGPRRLRGRHGRAETPTGRYALLYWGLHSHCGLFIVGPLLAVFWCFWATVRAWLLVTPLTPWPAERPKSYTQRPGLVANFVIACLYASRLFPP